MHRFIVTISRWMAFLGGAFLCILVAITVISILGRAANTIGHWQIFQTTLLPIGNFLSLMGPVRGDVELVEAGVAAAVMAFLPICQLNRGHANVDLFTAMLPGFFNRFLALFWEAVFAFVLVIITWRLIVGTSDKLRYGETTFLLQFPIWWAYAASAALGVVACMVALYSVYLHWVDLLSGPNDSDLKSGSTGH